MKIFGSIISINFKSVIEDNLTNVGERRLGLFTSRQVTHNWVTKNNVKKYYQVDYQFGIDLLWCRVWLNISKNKDYNYSIKVRKNKSEIFWDI